MSVRISANLVEKLKQPTIVWDDAVRGFGVRLTENGVKSYILNYRISGRQRRYTIGRCDEWTLTAARDEAEKLRGEIAKGVDPMERREAHHGAPTFRELKEAYLQDVEHTKRPGSLRNDKSMAENNLMPRLGHRKLADIHKADMAKIHRDLKATPYRANRVLALASAMFTWAIEAKTWGVTENPARGGKKGGIPHYREERYEKWMTREQLEALEKALTAYHDQTAADAIRLLILTGSRKAEVLNAEWSQFDLKRGVWTKPSHHTKQKKTEHVPLNRAAIMVLERLAEHKTGPYLFPGRNGGKARVTLHRPWVQVSRAAGLATEYAIQGKRGPLQRYKPMFRPHALRHTYASHLVSKGESLYIVGKLLGHTRSETTQRYADLADESLRDAANKFWPEYTNVRKSKAKVVKMKTAGITR